MKALSIKQPWASLIAAGIKDIENRTWRTNYRGRIYIHVSSAKFNLKYSPLTAEQANAAHEGHKIGKIGDADALPYSAIIGEVDIVDCVLNAPSIWSEETDLTEGKIFYPIWNWVLANPVLYDNPILNVKGKLSLWEYERPYEVIGTAEMVQLGEWKTPVG